MPVIPPKKVSGFLHVNEKLEDCPCCGKELKGTEYEFQVCLCGDFPPKSAIAELLRDIARRDRAAKG